jgi:hypothetical protein
MRFAAVRRQSLGLSGVLPLRGETLVRLTLGRGTRSVRHRFPLACFQLFWLLSYCRLIVGLAPHWLTSFFLLYVEATNDQRHHDTGIFLQSFGGHMETYGGPRGRP